MKRLIIIILITTLILFSACISEKIQPTSAIIYTEKIQPTSALCGIKERMTTPQNRWLSEPVDCSSELSEKDYKFYNITFNYSSYNISKIPLRNMIQVVEVKFDLTKYKDIAKAEAIVDMICKAHLSIFTLTEFNDWKPAPDFYFKCGEFNVKERKIANIEPIILNNTAYILIAPGTGDSEGFIDQVYMNISYFKS